VFDAPGRTFRDELFEQYKAHRPPMPDDLRAQIEPVLETVAALGLPLLRISGVEADDVIGTLARLGTEAGMTVVISTGDKDMAQLVSEQVTCINTMTGSRLDVAGVKAKFDVTPAQIVDYLALVGDSADNIPGVPKVGPKTAAKWLGEYGTLDRLIENAASIEGKVGESLRAHLGDLDLSRRLATIDCALALDTGLAALARQPADQAALAALYRRLELNSLLRSLPDTASVAATTPDGRAETAPAAMPAQPERHYRTVLTEADLDQLLAALTGAPLFAVDTETTSLNYMVATMVGLSFATGPGEAWYVPVAHDYPGAPDQLAREHVLGRLRPLLEDPTRLKVGHHVKYDRHIFANHGVRLAGAVHDSMLESYVLNSVVSRHDMDSLAQHYLGLRTIRFEDVAGKGAKQLTFNQVPIDMAAPYAAEDADVTLRLHETVWADLGRQSRLRALYEEIEAPLIEVLGDMERTGVLVDRELLRVQSGELAARMQQIELEAHREAGGPFNLDSPKQLQQILFERLGLPVARKTPTGQPSTAEDVLEDLAIAYPLPRLILEHRSLAKLKGTYTDRLPEQINAASGRIHTSYHQAVAATGRLSSSDPNLQNIPVRTEEGRKIRKAFVAEPGHVLISADYSQIELRIMAHLSGDEGLLGAFAADRDIHEATAAEIFGVAPEAVDKEQRRAAKTINFGLIYGMSAFGLAARLNVDRGSAARYIESYFERYPGVRRYMDDTRRLAREQGYVETVAGRRLYLPDIRSKNKQLQQYAERSAINAPMQGTAADIIKRAMIDVSAWLATSGAAARLVMQVHDELVLEVREDALDQVRDAVVRLMSGAVQLAVPLRVEAGTGRNWDEAH
jgi:DNA polymerase-1